MEAYGFGQSLLRQEDRRLLTGRGRFTGDIDLPRQAHGQVLRSPHAHAEIRAIDASAAKRAPGVFSALRARDQYLSTSGRQAGILMDVHSVLLR